MRKDGKCKASASGFNPRCTQVVSDQLIVDIITAISNGVTNSNTIMQILDLRTSRLYDIGIVSRGKGEIILTSFGRLVYKAQLKIAAAFSRASELRMVDSVKSHSDMPDD
jgi:hypothetical protein